MNQADLAMCILRKIEIIRVGPHMVEFRRKVSGYDDLPFAFIIGGQITEHRTIGPAGKYIMQSLEAALNLLHPDSGLESFINAASILFA